MLLQQPRQPRLHAQRLVQQTRVETNKKCNTNGLQYTRCCVERRTARTTLCVSSGSELNRRACSQGKGREGSAEAGPREGLASRECAEGIHLLKRVPLHPGTSTPLHLHHPLPVYLVHTAYYTLNTHSSAHPLHSSARLAATPGTPCPPCHGVTAAYHPRHVY